MKILDAGQEALVARAGVTRVDLYVLTTYTNRDEGTVQEVFYFSDRFRRYDFGNTGTVREFLPLVRTRTGPDAKSMSHIQDFGASTVETFEVVLANIPQESGEEPFIQVLRRHNLFRSTLEVAELFIPPGHSGSDLTDFDGDEHTVVYRGEQRELVRATADTIGLAFVSETPTPGWLYADGPTVDPRDLGIRLPLVYGDMKLVQAVGIDVGGETTLASALTDSATTADVTDCSRFSASGVVWINGERITYSSRNVNAGTLNGLVRGTSTTDPAAHPMGSQVVEVQASKFAVAGHPVKAIGNVYVRKNNGKLLRLTSGHTKNAAEAAAGPDGETIATVRLTAQQMEDLLNAVQTGAAVTQQPSVNQQTEITTTALQDLGHGQTTPVTGWHMQSLSGQVSRTGYANSRIRQYAPTVESLLGTLNSADHWDVTIAGGPLGTEAISGSPTIDLTFYLAVGSGAGADNYSFAQNRYSVAERDSGAGAKTYGILLGPYTIPAGSTLAAFTETISFDDVPLDSPGTTDVNRMMIQVVALAGAQGVWFTNSPPAAWNIYAGLATSAVVETTITTDIEVAGDDASEVKISGDGKGSSEPFSLRVFADVQGAMADDGGDYSVAEGELLETMPDILRHFIAEFCGEGQEVVDAETFDAALIALGSNVHACDARAFGTTFAQVASRLAWESRANIQRAEEFTTTTWRLYCADENYVWPSPSVTIDEYVELEERSRDPESVRTRFRALYNWDASVGSISVGEAFRSALRADKTSNALTNPSVIELDAAEAIFGRRDQDPFVFGAIRDTDTALNVLGYYATEATRDSRVWGLQSVPWTQAYKLEPGDLVALAGLPWATTEGWYARVLSVTRDPDSGMANVVLFMVSPASFRTALFAEAEVAGTLSVTGAAEMAAALAATATMTAALSDLTSYLAAALSSTASFEVANLSLFGDVTMAAALAAEANVIANLRQFGPVELGEALLDAEALIATASLLIVYAIETALDSDSTLDGTIALTYFVAAALAADAALTAAAVVEYDLEAALAADSTLEGDLAVSGASDVLMAATLTADATIATANLVEGWNMAAALTATATI